MLAANIKLELTQNFDVGSLKAFFTLSDVEGNLLAVLQSFEAVSLNFGEVREQVVAIVVRRNEAEAFSVVKPLNGTSCHDRNPR
jgi:hypothetical protein|tara:strand:+ start:11 stop:262 length:252 start_codon:yes stop_codon:yes gene_type:complete